MTVCACILKSSPVKLWGLDSQTRIIRQLNESNINRILDDPSSLPADCSQILLVRGDYLYDNRVLQELVDTGSLGSVLAIQAGKNLCPVAAFVNKDMTNKALQVLQGRGNLNALSDLRIITPKDWASLGVQQELRKLDLPYVLPISEKNKKILEKHLFSGSYKGITDFVTKWVWPPFARQAVRFCIKYNIGPTQVTIFSLLLVIIVTVLFFYGNFLSGLVLAWFMTFLDTVDGKLARVTLTSSKFGGFLDHALDLIHPPIWYIAWGLGVSVATPRLEFVLWIIVLGYLGGRLAEGAFYKWIGGFQLFSWRPLDSFFRLITARRNPNLIILTAGIIVSKPYLGLIGLAVWTLLTTLVLLLRVYQALEFKKKYGYIISWLTDTTQNLNQSSLAVKMFSNTSSAALMQKLN